MYLHFSTKLFQPLTDPVPPPNSHDNPGGLYRGPAWAAGAQNHIFLSIQKSTSVFRFLYSKLLIFLLLVLLSEGLDCVWIAISWGLVLLLISSPSLISIDSLGWDGWDGWGWCSGIERMKYEKVCLFQVYVGFSVMGLVVDGDEYVYMWPWSSCRSEVGHTTCS